MSPHPKSARLRQAILYLQGLLLCLAACLPGLAQAQSAWFNVADLATARNYHTATLLPSGQVLVAGGYGSSGTLPSAELYDPTSNTWRAAGNMTTARSLHTATLLSSGQVLVTGGMTVVAPSTAPSCMTRPPILGVRRAT